MKVSLSLISIMQPVSLKFHRYGFPGSVEVVYFLKVTCNLLISLLAIKCLGNQNQIWLAISWLAIRQRCAILMHEAHWCSVKTGTVQSTAF